MLSSYIERHGMRSVPVCRGECLPFLIPDRAHGLGDLLPRKPPRPDVSQAGLLSPVSFEQLAHTFHKVLASQQKHGFDLILPVGFPLAEPCGLFELASILSRQFPRSPFTKKVQNRCSGQPFWLFGTFQVGSIGTPGIISQGIDSCFGQLGSCLSRALLVTTQAGDPYRIQVNVTVDHQGLSTWLMEHGLKAPLKKWPHSLILTIEPNAVGAIEPLDRSAEIGLWSLNLQIVMVGHQYIDVNPHPETFWQPR